MSHSAGNHESAMLAKRFVSSKSRGDFDKNTWEKSHIGDPSDFLKSSLLQNIKKEWDPLVQSKLLEKKSHSAEKIQVKNTKRAKGGSLYVFEVLDVGFVLDEVLTYPICFGHA